MPLNILVITADDMGAEAPGCLGGPSWTTPHLDALGASGAVLGHAFVPIAVCQPSRAAMLSGRWPHRNGAMGFEPMDEHVELLTDVLREQGYLTGALGKLEHLQPQDRLAWDFTRDRADLADGRDATAYGASARTFVRSAREQGRPWFLLANSHDPHRPFHGSDEEQTFYPPEVRDAFPEPSRTCPPDDEVRLPGYLPDLPEVEREYREYLSSVRRCDDTIGALLRVLEEEGLVEDTLVVFHGDHGIALPWAKASCYRPGIHVPVVLRWPGEVEPGTRIDAWTSTLDLLPTLCEAAGARVPEGVDGHSLGPLLRGEVSTWREEVVSVFHENSGGMRLEMRGLHRPDRTYVWNAWADGTPRYRAENMWGRSWAAMVEAAEGDPAMAARTDFYLRRAPEELYDTQVDPDALDDLASSSEHADDLAACRAALLRWMEDVEDPLVEQFRAHLGTTVVGA
ncbi:sulfatase family protein [Nocardioides bruguierae]|uniref:Sulfatase n=1 Tax=Nocardioides bruguierae TaxID=2945102 RepID=A0A9X2IGA6_9ACTN|nr:sulfatase [Nocardioides bruguierae]MCM0621369.1 sulfatase [Nocardioides bruguierae]